MNGRTPGYAAALLASRLPPSDAWIPFGLSHLLGLVSSARPNAKDTAMYTSHITSRRQIETEPPKRLTPAGFGSGDIDARDVKAQEAAEGCAEYERPQEYRQYR